MTSRRKRSILLDEPNVGEAEKRYLAKAVDTGYVSTVGPFVGQFERIFARYCGTANAVSTQSGTAALQVSLYELGIGAGDEVIVPVLTFVASVNPVIHAGAKPVFVDVDPATWNMDVRQVEKAITKKTKAIMPVHLYGNPCEMDALLFLARQNKLAVIEDATESLGASYRGRPTGTLGDFGCFSFNGNKIITTGGGGMIVGRDAGKVRHIKFLVNQARDERDGFFHSEPGFNYRMTNIEAALGLAQMGRLGFFLKKKRLFNAIYREELKKVKRLRFQQESPGARGSCWITSVVWEGGRVADLQKDLKERGIPTRRIFRPVTAFPYCSSYTPKKFPEATAVYEQGICLPSSTINSAEDIGYVCSVLKELL